jgi:hypothetical protein
MSETYTPNFERETLAKLIEETFHPLAQKVILDAIETGVIEKSFGDVNEKWERNLAVTLHYYFTEATLAELAVRFIEPGQEEPVTEERVRTIVKNFLTNLRKQLGYQSPIEGGYWQLREFQPAYYERIAAQVRDLASKGLDGDEILNTVEFKLTWATPSRRWYRDLTKYAARVGVEMPELPRKRR